MPTRQKTKTQSREKATVGDIMTTRPAQFDESASVSSAAQAMRDNGIGAVLVTEDGKLCGLLTDRDIAIRAVAGGKDPNRLQIGDICSRELWTLSPEDSLAEAVELMREKSVRRVPVVQNGGDPVGIVSLGDLALRLDPSSALGGISAAQPNL